MDEITKEILNHMIRSGGRILVEEAAERLSVSKRTVLDKLKGQKDFFEENGFCIAVKYGENLTLRISDADAFESFTHLYLDDSSPSEEVLFFRDRQAVEICRMICEVKNGRSVEYVQEHLHLSRSTMYRKLNAAKQFLSRFNLNLKTDRGMISLEGNEYEIRMAYLALFRGGKASGFYEAANEKLRTLLEERGLWMFGAVYREICLYAVLAVKRYEANCFLPEESGLEELYDTDLYRIAEEVFHSVSETVMSREEILRLTAFLLSSLDFANLSDFDRNMKIQDLRMASADTVLKVKEDVLKSFGIDLGVFVEDRILQMYIEQVLLTEKMDGGIRFFSLDSRFMENIFVSPVCLKLCDRIVSVIEECGSVSVSSERFYLAMVMLAAGISDYHVPVEKKNVLLVSGTGYLLPEKVKAYLLLHDTSFINEVQICMNYELKPEGEWIVVTDRGSDTLYGSSIFYDFSRISPENIRNLENQILMRCWTREYDIAKDRILTYEEENVSVEEFFREFSEKRKKFVPLKAERLERIMRFTQGQIRTLVTFMNDPDMDEYVEIHRLKSGKKILVFNIHFDGSTENVGYWESFLTVLAGRDDPEQVLIRKCKQAS